MEEAPKEHSLVEDVSEDNVPNNVKGSLNAKNATKDDFQKRREELDRMSLRNVQADMFEKYIYETGISTAFQLIFSELITKKIPVENYYDYTVTRLKEFGEEFDKMKSQKK